jgi:hypothetical protein
LSVLTYTYLYSSVLFSSFLSSSSFPSSFNIPPSFNLSSHSFYTCRYFDILIYISSHPNQQFDPAQIIGGMSRVVDGYWYRF